jgi:Trehalose utilisation
MDRNPAYPAAWNGLAKVWVQVTSGGAPFPPSFYEMFAQPMFSADMKIWELDHPYDFHRLFASGGYGTHGKGLSYLFTSDRGKGIPSRPPIPKDMPDDYPWDPSGGRGDPGFDILVLNDQLDWPEETRTIVQKAVAAKKGMVILHHALGDNQNWPWWYEEVTGGLLVLDNQSGKSKSRISRAAVLDLEPVNKHPILTGVRAFRLEDDTAYLRMWQSQKITPLLETKSSQSNKTVAWIGPCTDTRVVCIQPGGSMQTHRNEDYRKLVRNSILWCAGRL